MPTAERAQSDGCARERRYFRSWLLFPAPGAPAHSAHLHVLDQTHQITLVQHDPGDERRDNHQRRQICGHDESRVGTERRAHAAACAWIIIMVRSRRRRISLRIAARCSVKNKSVNATSIASSGTRMLTWMVDPLSRSTEAPWCKVFHQSTENLMMGMLIRPTSVSTAAARAAWVGSSIVRHSAITPRYIRNRISTEVSRASQTQYVPHIGRPHNEPVSRHISVKAAPIGAAALAATSASGCRHTSVPSAAADQHNQG